MDISAIPSHYLIAAALIIIGVIGLAFMAGKLPWAGVLAWISNLFKPSGGGQSDIEAFKTLKASLKDKPQAIQLLSQVWPFLEPSDGGGS